MVRPSPLLRRGADEDGVHAQAVEAAHLSEETASDLREVGFGA